VQEHRQLRDQRCHFLGGRSRSVQVVAERRLESVSGSHQQTVELLGAMVTAEPGEDLGGEQCDRVRQVAALMLLVTSEVLQGSRPGKHVEPGGKPGIGRIQPGARRDLRTGQADTVGRLGSDQDGLRQVNIRRVLGDAVDADQHRRQ